MRVTLKNDALHEQGRTLNPFEGNYIDQMVIFCGFSTTIIGNN
jgi:hypothetical protein